MSSWTQPICDACWEKEEPDRVPVRLREDLRDPERCCMCGVVNTSGIYIRKDPTKVKHPQLDYDS